MTTPPRPASASTSMDGSDLRIDLDPDNVGRGLAQIVIAVLELLRELLERQAIRRVDAGDLSADQVERLGSTLHSLRHQLNELSQSLARPDSDQISALQKVLSNARSDNRGGNIS